MPSGMLDGIKLHLQALDVVMMTVSGFRMCVSIQWIEIDVSAYSG